MAARTLAAVHLAVLASALANSHGQVTPEDCFSAKFADDQHELIISAAPGEIGRLRNVLKSAHLPCVAQLQIDGACLVQVTRQEGQSAEALAELLRTNIFAVKGGVAPPELQKTIGGIVVNAALERPNSYGQASDQAVATIHSGPSDPLFPSQTELLILEPEAAWFDEQASTTRTAIVDSGVQMDHEDLAGQFVGGATISCQSGACDGSPVPEWDNRPHGTLVAGIIAAMKDNALGIAGVASRTQFLSINHGPAINDFRAACSFQYAIANDAHIINASWFGGNNPWPEVAKYIIAAEEKGILIVMAAGDENVNLDEQPRYPLGMKHPNLLGVMGFNFVDVEPDGATNYGAATVHIAGPNLASNTTVYCEAVKNCYGSSKQEGTSWATAYVTGAAALLKSRHPGVGYDFLKWRIIANATADPRLSGKSVSGGRLNLVRTIYPVTARLGVVRSAEDWRIDWNTGIRRDMCTQVSIQGRFVQGGNISAPFDIVALTANDGEENLPRGSIPASDAERIQLHVKCVQGAAAADSVPLPLE